MAQGNPGTGRVVYSTSVGRVCPGCGWPADSCRCSTREEEGVPAVVTAKLRLSTAGRSGKTVTVIEGLPRNGAFLAELEKALKKACGTGGTVREGVIELQGDRREQAERLLATRGHRVKGGVARSG